MSDQNKGQNFLDSKTIFAIILVGVSWMGWQYYMQSKYPDLYKEKANQTELVQTDKNNIEEIGGETVGGQKSSQKEEVVESTKRDELAKEPLENIEPVYFEDDKWSFKISPKGMGIKDVKLKDYKERNGQDKKIGSSQEGIPFSTNVIGKRSPLYFNVKKISQYEYVGTAKYGNVSLEKRYAINSENHTIDTKVIVSGVSKEDRFTGVTTLLGEKLHKPESDIPFLPVFEIQEVYALHDGESDRLMFSEQNEESIFSKVKLAAISTQYFAQAILDKSDVMPEVKARIDSDKMYAQASLSHSVINRSQDFFVSYIAFAGPRSISLLNKIDKNMAEIVDFGWFSGLAKIILKIMKFFHSVFGNWGIAIILLTILVRLIVLPFHMMSIRSMKKMQELQPQIKELREKLKDDPQRMNQEMMQLFKANKTNPMGGCLPMLLQFPVFIALYRMLGQSIELYQAPFMLWITDLSLKDPYYILPVLMGVTMFVQQKVTPSTMDPAQQKIFMFMPIMFSLFMITLPSGLTLYIFVSALFAVIQQVVIMRDRKPQTA